MGWRLVAVVAYAAALDLNMDYYIIMSDAEASKMCTIIFPWGKFSCCKLPMGFGGLAGIFQAHIMDLIASPDYVRVYINDLLTCGIRHFY